MNKICLLIVMIIIHVPITGYSQYFPLDTAKLNSAYRELIRERNSLEILTL
jgi:hypothetical protein